MLILMLNTIQVLLQLPGITGIIFNRASTLGENYIKPVGEVLLPRGAPILATKVGVPVNSYKLIMAANDHLKMVKSSSEIARSYHPQGSHHME